MKNIISFLIFAIALNSCNKDDDPKPTNPIDQLPPATQTGANTFGCLLDGEVFKPDNLPNSTNCFYQYVNGGYYFNVRASKKDKNNVSETIALKTENKQIEQGITYDLLEAESNETFGGYFYGSLLNYTNLNYSGKLTITKLDKINFIVSGTFWFDVKDNLGVVHQIREGRFDMEYTN